MLFFQNLCQTFEKRGVIYKFFFNSSRDAAPTKLKKKPKQPENNQEQTENAKISPKISLFNLAHSCNIFEVIQKCCKTFFEPFGRVAQPC